MQIILQIFVIYNYLIMDLLNNSTKYQKYLDRINEYKKIADKNQAFSSIKGRVENLSQDLKSKKDRDFYRHIHLGLLVLSILVAACCLYFNRYFSATLLLAGALASKYLYTHTLKSLIKHTSEEKAMEQTEKAFDLKLFHHMQYLKNGIELKSARISIVRYSFMAIFPIILVSIVSLSGLATSVSTFVLSSLAILMACLFWFYFFKDDLDELDYQEMELQEYIHDFMINQHQPSQTNKSGESDADINSKYAQLSVG